MDYDEYISVRHDAESIVKHINEMPPKKENQIVHRPLPKVVELNRCIQKIENGNTKQRDMYLDNMKEIVHKLKYEHLLTYRIKSDLDNLINEIIN